jgi:hypothetical protein
MAWAGDRGKRMLCAGSLGDSRAKVLFPVESSVSYAAPGWLLFIRQDRLMAQHFDSGSLRTSGDPIVLAPDVGYLITNGWSDFSVSQNGSLVYKGLSSRFTRMTWFDRGGRQLGTVGEPGLYLRPSISPDQQHAAVVKLDPEVGGYDIWTADLVRGILSRLTFDAANDDFPQWSPDSASVLFFSNRTMNGAAGGFFEVAADSPGTETMIFPFRPGAIGYPLDWSTDGRTVLVMKPSDRTGFDIWRSEKSGRSIGAPAPVLESRFNEIQARLSPDGSRVAYVSDESGRNEVYLSPFPAASTKLRISSSGGTEPRWRGDGRELFYFSTDQQLMSVMLSRELLSASSPQELFRAAPGRADTPAAGTGYAVTKDGRRFLIPVSSIGEGAEAITILMNWWETHP